MVWHVPMSFWKFLKFLCWVHCVHVILVLCLSCGTRSYSVSKSNVSSYFDTFNVSQVICHLQLILFPIILACDILWEGWILESPVRRWSWNEITEILNQISLLGALAAYCVLYSYVSWNWTISKYSSCFCSAFF